MIKTVKQLKKERPDLVELFEGMTHKQLLKQIYLEVIDALNMEERMQTFMSECTNLSKTTYTPEVIKQLVQDKWEADLSYWCKDALEDIEGMNLEEVKHYLKAEIK